MRANVPPAFVVRAPASAAGMLLPLLGLAALLFPTAADADQLIQIPTADRVAAPTIEYKQRVEATREGYGTLLIPAGTAFELMLRYSDENRQHRLEGGGQVQILPDGYVTPGLSVGVWDITNSSPWGRRGFLIITKSLRQGQFGLVPKPLRRVQLTLGTGTGRFSGVLAGLRIDLPARVSLVSEYDSRRLNAGIWFSPLKPLTLKAELQNGNPYLGGEVRVRF